MQLQPIEFKKLHGMSLPIIISIAEYRVKAYTFKFLLLYVQQDQMEGWL